MLPAEPIFAKNDNEKVNAVEYALVWTPNAAAIAPLATEAKVPEIVDAIVDVTETGSTLRAHGMKVIDTLLESEVLLIANDPAARA